MARAIASAKALRWEQISVPLLSPWKWWMLLKLLAHRAEGSLISAVKCTSSKALLHFLSFCVFLHTDTVPDYMLPPPLFTATPSIYGSSQARDQIRPADDSLCHSQQYQIRASSGTYPVVCGNARSLTHWARPGDEPTSLGTLCWFLTHKPQRELLQIL